MKLDSSRYRSAPALPLAALRLLGVLLAFAGAAHAAPTPTATITEQDIVGLAGGAGDFWVFDTFDTDGPGVGGDPSLSLATPPALLAGYGTSSVRMDSGPGSGGAGCARLGGKAFLGTRALAGTRLSDLLALGYSHLVDSTGGALAAANVTPAINIYVDRNGDGQWRAAQDSILIYEPYYTLGQSTQDVWYDNLAIGAGATGRWHYDAQSLPGVGLFVPNSVDLWGEVISQPVGGAGFDPTATTIGDLRIVNPDPGCAADNSQEGTGSGLVIAVGQKSGSPWDNFVVFIDGAYLTSSGAAAQSFVHNFDLTPLSYTIGGTVNGLAGTGLALQNNGGDVLSISGNGPFTFPTALVDLSAYTVTVQMQPGGPSQTCSVANGSGALAGSNVTNISVSCSTESFTVGGTVSGLVGAGLVLRNNGGDDVSISGNGPFTFPTALVDLSAYAVTVQAQPGGPSQTCSVANGSGALAGSNVTNISVSCSTESFTVGGTVSGLVGAGLVLRNNGGDDLSISGNGPFTFPTALVDLSAYAVTVQAQPIGPAQTCSVSNGSGALAGGNVTGVSVTCSTDSFTVGGTISGLVGAGLVLRNNGGDNLPISGNGPFTFAAALADLSGYVVTVQAQPGGQVCTVSSGSGSLDGANVTDVVVDCDGIRIGLSASALAFTSGPDNAVTSAPLVISNPGTVPLQLFSISPPDSPFSIGANTCQPLPLALAPGEQCVVTVQFSARSGTYESRILIESDAVPSPAVVIVRGGGAPVVVPVFGQLGLWMLLGLLLVTAAVHLRHPR